MAANSNPANIQEMIDLCAKMLEKSYCIYSNFPVASVLVAEDGATFTGECKGSLRAAQFFR